MYVRDSRIPNMKITYSDVRFISFSEDSKYLFVEKNDAVCVIVTDQLTQAIQNNTPKEPPKPSEPEAEKSIIDYGAVDFSDISSADPRLDRLLDLLKEKGVLSVLDIERVKFN